MDGFALRIADQSAPWPRFRRANFQSESPGCTRTVFAVDTETADRGTADAGATGNKGAVIPGKEFVVRADGTLGFAGETDRGSTGARAGKILEGTAGNFARREGAGADGRTGSVAKLRDFVSAGVASGVGLGGCAEVTKACGAAMRGEIFGARAEPVCAAGGIVGRS